jgi:tRNA uridine 5-carboxymethylaminomethyl modification enzyme
VRAAAFAELLESTKLSDDDVLLLENAATPLEAAAAADEEPVEPVRKIGAQQAEQLHFARGDRAGQLLKRPAVSVEMLLPALVERIAATPALSPWATAIAAANPRPSTLGPRPSLNLPAWVRNEMKTVETSIKFAGYLAQQQRSMERLRRDEARAIPEWFDYTRVSGLSREMVEKLGRVRPATLGQASRIAGVTPAAVSLIQCFLEIWSREAAAQRRIA